MRRNNQSSEINNIQDRKLRKKIMTTVKKTLLTMLVFATSFSINGKKNEGVIMTVDGEEVPTEEFLYLFHKNNQQQAEPQTLEEYLQLFKIYRLKVAEAKRQGVDTTSNFIKETDLYRKELLEPYITDSVLFNSFVAEAAERENQFVESSHIMIIRTHNEERDTKNLALLDSIHTALLDGADFIELAKTYSQDKFSSDKGGYLGFTPAGSFPYGFETAVYETPEGGISDIVESHVGWHIVKSGARKPAEDFNKPKKSLDEIKSDLARKLSSPFDPRFHIIRNDLISRLKAKHPEVNTEGMSEDEAYNVLLKAEEDTQYKQNPEYRNLVDEYVNGSLLYEVSVENVWNKASNDNEGLEKYFEANRDKYKWVSPHAKGYLIHAQNDSIATLLKEGLASLPHDSIVPYIKENFKKEAIIEMFNVSQGTNPTIDYLMFGADPVASKYKNYPVYFTVEGRIVEQPEELGDVKSAVVNDYQEVLETQWVENLKKDHIVEVNKKELARIRKSIKD